MVIMARHRILRSALLFLLITAALGPAGAFAQEDEALDWIFGPATCQLGRVAEVEIPDGYQFVAGDGTRQILEWWENPTNGSELGLVMPSPDESGDIRWVVVFEYDPIGYVRDTEKDDLDADGLMDSFIEGSKHSNKIRRERGWSEFHITGWEREPYYDVATNNLRWAIRGHSEGTESINFSTRLLGRGGAMSADLVLGPEKLADSLPEYDALLADFTFTEGQRYAEFREGDKVAKYGLTALVAGGAGAVAMKTGLLARFWKFILVGIAAAWSFIRRLFSRGKSSDEVVAEPVEPDHVETAETVEALPEKPTDRDA